MTQLRDLEIEIEHDIQGITTSLESLERDVKTSESKALIERVKDIMLVVQCLELGGHKQEVVNE